MIKEFFCILNFLLNTLHLSQEITLENVNNADLGLNNNKTKAVIVIL